MIKIYTDGSSRGNPGPGGYGIVLIYKDKRKELSQGYKLTTNNRMELTAVIKALEAIKNDKIYSPKQKFYKGITLKQINKEFNINYLDISLENLNEYKEILLVGSGKGVISVSSIQGVDWRRKSLKYYKILNDYYEKAVTKCPIYYGWSINLTILQI